MKKNCPRGKPNDRPTRQRFKNNCLKDAQITKKKMRRKPSQQCVNKTEISIKRCKM